MLFNFKVFAVILALIFGWISLSLIRKPSVHPLYRFLWVIISFLMITVPLFEGVYKSMATAVGLTDAPLLITMGVILFLLIYVMYLSIKISEVSDRTQELISSVSIIDRDMRKLTTEDKKE